MLDRIRGGGRPGAQNYDESIVATANQVKRFTLIATILASSMTFIDGTVVNVALPALAGGASTPRSPTCSGSSRRTRCSSAR